METVLLYSRSERTIVSKQYAMWYCNQNPEYKWRKLKSKELKNGDTYF
jgi:hypothetical protein